MPVNSEWCTLTGDHGAELCNSCLIRLAYIPCFAYSWQYMFINC
uniref:Uncharacterized protein n=1 Tax=Arundo donax TaxID=35708 RepID=A0A0A8YMA8_ARUDO